MNTARRAVATAAVLALSTAGLAACSADTGDDGEGQTITWWATNLASTVTRDQEILDPIIQAFTDETGIEVDYEVNTWNDYYNKVLGAVSSGEGPDLMSIGTTWTQTLGDTGAFLPWTEDRLAAIGGADALVQSSYGAAGGNGDTEASFLPLISGVNAMWYNPVLLAEAGIDEPPTTWDEFVDDAKALTQDTDGDGDIDQWGFGYPGGFAVEWSHYAFAYGVQNGSDFFDDDGNPTLDSEGLLTTARQVVDLVATDQVIDPASAEVTSNSATFQEFIDGRIAIMFGPSPESAFADAGFTDYAAAVMPLEDPLAGRPVTSHIAGVNIGVFAETEHEDATLQFVNYLLSPEVQVQLSNELAVLPVSQAAYDSPDVTKTQAFAVQAEILADYAETFPLNTRTGQAETLVGDAFKQLFTQAATEGAVTDAQIRDVLTTANDQLIAAG